MSLGPLKRSRLWRVRRLDTSPEEGSNRRMPYLSQWRIPEGMGVGVWYLLVIGNAETAIVTNSQPVWFTIPPRTLCHLLIPVEIDPQNPTVGNVDKVQATVRGADRPLQENVRWRRCGATAPFGRLPCAVQRVRNAEKDRCLNDGGRGEEIHGGLLGDLGCLGVVWPMCEYKSSQTEDFRHPMPHRTLASATISYY
jgi:hypothetical protein